MKPRFWNTLAGRKEEFTPLVPEEARLYTCGPTVYDFAHIGNFRTYVFEDILRRTLEYAGYRVTQVMNITDIDDKTIRRSLEAGVSLAAYTDRYERAFYEDRDTLRIRPAEFYPRATDHVPEMVAIIRTLLYKGIAYHREGSIYFSISRFPAYGRLAGLDPAALRDGARVDSDEYDKDNPRDFVLWKQSRPGEPSFDTELGPGRPGWHIECSAMSMKYLGASFDIHTGGVDNIFPHHENEIAQSEACTGQRYARFFLHSAHLRVSGAKMAKSRGNFHTLRDLLDQGHDPLAIRYLLLAVPYRHPLNFTPEALAAAGAAVKRLGGFYRRLDPAEKDPAGEPETTPGTAALIDRGRRAFENALADDLNTAGALAAVHDLVSAANPDLERGVLPAADRRAIGAFMVRADRVFAILPEPPGRIAADVHQLVAEREEARRQRDFRRADEIRDQLAGRGITLEDTAGGTRIIGPDGSHKP